MSSDNYICACYKSGVELLEFIELMNLDEITEIHLKSLIAGYTDQVAYDS